MFLDPLFPEWNSKATRLVTSLGLTDPRVSAAMRRVPRHRFVSRGLWTTAYIDTPLPVGPEATISAPHMVAIQLAAADITEGMRVMELGSGSGYLLALTSLLAGHQGLAVGIEFEPSLEQRSEKALREIGFDLVEPLTEVPAQLPASPDEEVPGRLSGRIHVHGGDGRRGCPHFAPYDRILVSYSAPPPENEPWLEQLAPHGKIVAPIERPNGTHLERWERTPSGWDVREGPSCLFVSRKP